MNTQESPVRVHKADKALQSKVGTGQVDDRVIERGQKVMDRASETVDFQPLALDYVKQLEGAIAAAKNSDSDMAVRIKAMTTPVMELKANSATFGYNLIGNLANIMLSFLEAIKTLDEDALSIVSAHEQTLKAIILKKMSGDGGAIGAQMQEELKGACNRYFAKRKA